MWSRSALAFVAWREYTTSVCRWSYAAAALCLVAIGVLYFSPTIRMSSSDSLLVEATPLARNSVYAVSLLTGIIGLLMAPVTIAIAADPFIRDSQHRMLGLVAACPLQPRHYLVARLAGTLASALTLPTILLTTVLLMQFFPSGGIATASPNMKSAIVAMGEVVAPFTVAIVCITFAICVRTSQPRRAYLVIPLLIALHFLLRQAVDRVELRFISQFDPSGTLYLGYWAAAARTNAQLNAMAGFADRVFVISRLALLICSGALIAYCVRGLNWEDVEVGASTRVRNSGPALRSQPRAPRRGFHILNALARMEWHHFMAERFVLVFLPVFAIALWRHADSTVGPFNAESIPTTYNVIRQNLWFLTVSGIAVAIYVSVEQTLRDVESRMDALVNATPVSSVRLLSIRFLTGLAVSGGVTLCGVAVCLGYQFAHDGGTLAARPLLELVGAIILPLLLLAHALGLCVAESLRSRVPTYLALSMIAGVYVWALFSGHQHWVYNLPAAGLFTYSDIAGFGPFSSSLYLHRLYLASLVAGLFVIAVWRRASLSRDTWTGGRVVFALAIAVALWSSATLTARVQDGLTSSATQELFAEYERVAKPLIAQSSHLTAVGLDLQLDLCCSNNRFTASGQYTLVNRTATPISDIYISANPRLLARGKVTLDGASGGHAGPGVLKFSLSKPIPVGSVVTLAFAWEGRAPDGLPGGSARLNAFTSREASLFTSTYRWEWLPIIGYAPEVELTNDDARQQFGLGPRALLPTVPSGGLFGHDSDLKFRATVRVAKGQDVLAPGVVTSVQSDAESTTYQFVSMVPIRLFAVIAGRWNTMAAKGNVVHFFPQHAANAADMLTTLSNARELFSSIYGPYKFGDLRIAELPQVGIWSGMAFPGLIPISEDVGFLTRETARRPNVNAYAIAHETAHQWWGSGLWPAHAVGAQVLTEGLATYSGLLFIGRSLGEEKRAAMFEDLEYTYLQNRGKGEEQAMTAMDGSRFSDIATAYQRSGIVFSMLADVMGEQAFHQSLAKFYRRYSGSTDQPTLAELFAMLVGDAPNVASFVKEFAQDTAVPNLVIDSAESSRLESGGWRTDGVIRNLGRGTFDVQIAAIGSAGHDSNVTQTLRMRGGDPHRVTIFTSYRPTQLILDPHRRVLLQERLRARRSIS